MGSFFVYTVLWLVWCAKLKEARKRWDGAVMMISALEEENERLKRQKSMSRIVKEFSEG